MACTSQQISDYFTNCLDTNATSMTCSTWTMSNMSCGACIGSKKSDSKWGPVLAATGYVSLNIAGCADIQGFMSCATAYEALDGCLVAACDSVCPVTDQTSFQQWQQCRTTASTGGCASYNTAEQSACAADGGLAQCFGFQTFQSGYDTITPMFCLDTSAPDGGTGNDSGAPDSGADSGASKDAGKGDSGAGADAGDDTFVKKGGCHCGTVDGDPGVLPTAIGAVLAVGALVRRKKRR